jgi:hypothetical protein
MPYFSGMKTASFGRRVVLSSVACLAVPYFSLLISKKKSTISGGKNFDVPNNVCLKYFSQQEELSEILL